jgi:hypothetical protein
MLSDMRQKAGFGKAAVGAVMPFVEPGWRFVERAGLSLCHACRAAQGAAENRLFCHYPE